MSSVLDADLVTVTEEREMTLFPFWGRIIEQALPSLTPMTNRVKFPLEPF